MRFLDLVDDLAVTSTRLSRRGAFLSADKVWLMTRRTLIRQDLVGYLTGLDDLAGSRSAVEDAAAMLIRMATIVHARWAPAVVVTDLTEAEIGPIAPRTPDLPMERYVHRANPAAFDVTVAGAATNGVGLLACYLGGAFDAAHAVNVIMNDVRFGTAAKLFLYRGDSAGGEAGLGQVHPSLLFQGVAARFGLETLSCLYLSNTTTAALYHG